MGNLVDAIIPARIGSKRLPKKNIRNLNGVPAIVRTIRNLQESGVFQNIIVSTDSDEIREICKPENIVCDSLRPPELSDDFTTILQVMKFELSLSGDINDPEKVTACIFPTAFLISAEEIIKAHKQFMEGAMNNFLICASSYRHPIERALVKGNDGKFSMQNPEFRLTRTQDLPKSYYDLGQFYFAKNQTWKTADDVFQGCDCYLVEQTSIIDIDDEQDWKLAEDLVLIQEGKKIRKPPN